MIAKTETIAEVIDSEPANDLSAEKGVLGSVLLVSDTLDDLALLLAPEDFYDVADRTIFARMLAMREANKRIDSTTLVAALRKANEFEFIGGAAYLAEILRSVPHAANAKWYAEIVRDCAARRAIRLTGERMLQIAAHGDVDSFIDSAETAVLAIREGRERGADRVNDIGQILQLAMENLEQRRAGKVAAGQPMGFSDVDGVVQLRNGELVVLAARPSVGKTAFALNVAIRVAAQQPVLFCSLEMNGVAVADRLLSSEAEVDAHRMQNGWLDLLEHERLMSSASRVSQLALDVDDSCTRSMGDIAAISRRVKRRRNGLGLIVVDYLQLIRPEDYRIPREQQVARIASRLKALARELDVPVLCLAQLNRQSESIGGSRPRLSHLRESGAIEQDADVVLFIHREEMSAQTELEKERFRGQAELIVAKNRNGPTGTVKLAWRGKYTRFDSCPQDAWGDQKAAAPTQTGPDEDDEYHKR